MSVEAFAAGRYRVERLAGQGAMSKVFLARDGELGRRVALKLLDETLASDVSFRARFAREARVAASLSHPNVVGVYDVGEADGVPYIVMEYVEGRPLDERLRDEGALPTDEVRAIALQMLAGLAHAHDRGLVHRDLKPGNLIQGPDGAIKIADFGIARAADATELTEAGTIVGTAAYLAPEQAEAGEVTPASDLFAFGVVLYELLTGNQPWQIDSLAALAGRRFAPAPELPPATPADLRLAVERCLEPEPRERPQSAAEVGAILRGAPDTNATAVIPRRREGRRARGRGRRSAAPLLAALALVAVLAALVFALGIWGRSDDAPPGGSPAPPPQVEPIPRGDTPAEDARNLAEWLREHSAERTTRR